MNIQHFSAGEYIQAQSERIERLNSEIQELRQQNATLAAINLKLRSTDLTAADIAESLRLGCPDWRAVAAELVPPCQCQQHELPEPLASLERHLTPIENRLLRHFWQHKGRTVDFATLIHAAGMRCADDMEAAKASLWVHIRRLRMKLEERSTLRVLTVRTIGYLLQEGERDQGELS